MPESGAYAVLVVIAAIMLAAVFLVAAVAKLRDRDGTATDFASLGLPGADLLAVAVPAVELGCAGLLVVAPGWGGVVAFALLVGFTTNLALVIRSGRVATCACFGGNSPEPVSGRHLVRNAGLAALALLATFHDGWIWQGW